MRKWFRVSAVILSLITAFTQLSPAYPQGNVDNFDQMTIDLWPDYDESAVLVLITALVPADASLPTTVTLPLPADATLNAVARITPQEQMVDDVPYTVDESAETISIELADERVRLEYYVPYTRSGDLRNFTFDWTTPIPVNAIGLDLQEPRHATGFTISPAPPTSAEGQDGLRYHQFPLRSLGQGETLSLTLAYELEPDELSADPHSTLQVEAIPTVRERLPQLLIALGGFLIGLAFLIHTISTGLKRRKAQPVTATYCSECGEKVEENGRFCPNCGTSLK